MREEEESADIRGALQFEMEGKLGRGRSKMVWRNLVGRDMEKYRMKDKDCTNRKKWRLNLRCVGKTC